tara:strand:+ start:84 stop:563 length:480 start_codon:yes stop_codon:yes gene_type:complete
LNFNSTISNPSSWINSNKELLGLNWSSNSISDHFKNKNCRNIFLQDNDIPKGVLLGHFLYEDQRTIEFEILHIAIIPDSRNQGFGYELLLELEKQLKKPTKSTKIFLEVNFGNKFAIKLYEKLGYKTYNERKNYYGSKSIKSSVSQDAILFAKSLNANT